MSKMSNILNTGPLEAPKPTEVYILPLHIREAKYEAYKKSLPITEANNARRQAERKELGREKYYEKYPIKI